ncbi:MAG TPA: VOC family protein [Baekduia sp.]|nr:VOC family protein [Baekduia sp.]
MLSVTPYVLYEDVASAVDWLTHAFGFHETVRYSDDKGVSFSELEFGAERLMVARFAEGFRNPKDMGYVSGQIYLTVDDVDAHYAQAKASGAHIISELEDKAYGLRMYIADDPQGQRWTVAEQVRDVMPEEWGGVTVRLGKPDRRLMAVADDRHAGAG